MSQAATVSPSIGSPDLEVIVTLSPPPASRRAMARPMPRLPPVTSTDRLMCAPCLRDCVRCSGRCRFDVACERTGRGRAAAARDRLATSWQNQQHRSDRSGVYRLPAAATGRRGASAGRELGAAHADFRAERIRGQQIGLSDANLETQFDSDDLGLAVRVVVDGTWGFAAAVDLTPEAAAHAAAGRRRRPGGRGDEHRADRARRRARARRRDLGVGLRGRPVRRPRRREDRAAR